GEGEPAVAHDIGHQPALRVMDTRAADELLVSAGASQTGEDDVDAVVERAPRRIEAQPVRAPGKERGRNGIDHGAVERCRPRMLGEGGVVADAERALPAVDRDRGAPLPRREVVLLVTG